MCNNLDESQRHYAEGKDPLSKVKYVWFHLHDIPEKTQL